MPFMQGFSVLGDDELDGLQEAAVEILELLNGEALIVDATKEVAVLDLGLDGGHGLFLLGLANGGADGGWVRERRGLSGAEGYGVNWVA